ncbi:MAG: sirohydrochlorin cobaltochelatase, partial [Clostridia bacterium]|nr:sirohydrochlorin cobaltochelatase [Clostridia bacterium]
MIDLLKDYDDGKTAIVYMGHGTEHEYNKIYAQMQDVLKAKGAANYYIGTVEAEPSIDTVLEAIADKGYTRVVLRDMMVVCGDHANNDMAGDEEDSWKSIFAAAGYEVECVLEGLGQVPEIQQIYVEHALAAIAQVEE